MGGKSTQQLDSEEYHGIMCMHYKQRKSLISPNYHLFTGFLSLLTKIDSEYIYIL